MHAVARGVVLRTVALSALAAGGLPVSSNAQTPADPTADADSSARPGTTTRWWWVSAQLNGIYQWHPPFRSPYASSNSLRAVGEHAASILATLYGGARVGARTEVLVDLESAGGGGISQALGLAGFTNLDVVRNPALGAAPYVARAILRQTFALGGADDEVPPGPLAVLTRLPARRLSLAIGKLSLADFFDVNSVGSDSHLQFLNWTVDNNGAYDYAADTRGYTIAAVGEFRDRAWALRWGEAVMPAVANGIAYDWSLRHAHSENLEIEVDRTVVPGQTGAIRLLGYVNHANMGSYREAIDAFLSGADSMPDVTAHRRPGRTKAGVGLNVEEGVGHGIAVFGRAGVNDGRVESFAYTEVDRTLELGAGWTGPPWRKGDRLGLAIVANGLAPDHREYLARGGLGFLLGDGALRYGSERIVEAYYTGAVALGLSVAFDVQHVVNPGYNRDRGPVTVFALRAHVDVLP